MIRTIIWFLYFALYLLVVSPFLKKADRLKKNASQEDYDAYIHGMAKRWASSLIRVGGGNVSVYGLEHIPEDEPVLFVSNHQGNFDIPVILSNVPRKTGFISKIEVMKLPMIRSWMSHLDCVFLDRKDRRQAVKSISAGAESLKNGHSLVIFPEGTRSKGRPVQAFKTGSFKLATKSGVPIIPVTIEGTHAMMESKNNRITPGDVSITFGEPLRIHQDEKMSMAELAEATRQRIIGQLRNDAYKPRETEESDQAGEA